MDVKAIREAIEACGEECTCDVDHVCPKHIKINRAMIVIDILSTIDPEAIRAEARAEALLEAADSACEFISQHWDDAKPSHFDRLRAAIANVEKPLCA